MSIIKTTADLQDWFQQADRRNKTLGFVPTMGYLHEGHLSLIRAAKDQNDLVAVSIFVNPTQFAPGEDYESYPRDTDRDYQLAMEAGADVVFVPAVEEIYPPGASTEVTVTGGITRKLCGISRPTHFQGVTRVVNILFNIMQPNRAYFGQKDAQQSLIIKKMVRELHLPVEIVVCPIVREADGLAMSSRNVYLTPEERQQAVCLNNALQKAESYFKSDTPDHAVIDKLRSIIKREIESHPLACIDYCEIFDGETLEDIDEILPGKNALAAVAVKFSKARLLDNRVLSI
ncbi:pantoate--beta-alanine ligase [Dehalobacterium formicoaceticum]|uniref:Pantothenate synthetase n=1 Tax=Dehalobacterium formicoaceticum TaxID=51515 RepID=A0ABT1Y6E1_9FIRM|nr:pantoate--beta-alanine ligase [Dehalobacterium formicoaceticum]MCR6546452.1 pantoate--beta-alanine ligase [Dehalobacterium formicoaceticum]